MWLPECGHFRHPSPTAEGGFILWALASSWFCTLAWKHWKHEATAAEVLHCMLADFGNSCYNDAGHRNAKVYVVLRLSGTQRNIGFTQLPSTFLRLEPYQHRQRYIKSIDEYRANQLTQWNRRRTFEHVVRVYVLASRFLCVFILAYDFIWQYMGVTWRPMAVYEYGQYHWIMGHAWSRLLAQRSLELVHPGPSLPLWLFRCHCCHLGKIEARVEEQHRFCRLCDLVSRWS